MEKIFVILGLVHFVNALFEKWGIWDKLLLVGSISKNRFFYDLTQCRFCLLFHLSIIFTLIHSICFGFNIHDLLIPFVVLGLTQLIIKR
ncbi:hypothetical protein HWC99_gp48 [Flavobacterium phage vB_FspS_tant8-1]|uniref:Uncharacterized protein n=1 Tax=Flavobacterium phage vB_FspS_tant8-1 TaxID=2686278 RepID=A0A6B9LVE5_9CAUD|nr:hypothetical protein HWC99_gp48 [Flavobacterium phage vB_FspS_tant8-1]QHB40979.1 hypothetical protein tant81_gp048 [Flavobacterium phage vB_FspS_tant8-1]